MLVLQYAHRDTQFFHHLRYSRTDPAGMGRMIEEELFAVRDLLPFDQTMAFPAHEQRIGIPMPCASPVVNDLRFQYPDRTLALLDHRKVQHKGPAAWGGDNKRANWVGPASCPKTGADNPAVQAVAFPDWHRYH